MLALPIYDTEQTRKVPIAGARCDCLDTQSNKQTLLSPSKLVGSADKLDNDPIGFDALVLSRMVVGI